MHIVILGNGITGLTAASALRKRDSRVRLTMISAETAFPFSRPSLMYVYMGHLRFADTLMHPPDFYRRNRIELLQGWVSRIDVAARRLQLADGSAVSYDRLLLATGSVPNRFGWPGQDLGRVQGLYSTEDLARLEQSSVGLRQAVIVGGGLIGIELAEMLHSRGVHVVFLVREASYWNNALPPEESAMVGELIRAEGIDLRLDSELKEILGDAQGNARAVITGAGEEIPCQLVGLTAGVRPNLGALADSGIATGRGISVDAQLRTSAPDVFAAGDCAEIQLTGAARPLLQQVWYTGRLQAEIAAVNLLGGCEQYRPGIWFNSAKFFDLEWHTYGTVSAKPGPEERHLVWQDPTARRLLRLVADRATDALLGMNALGIRYRHRVFERWISEARPIDYVLRHLSEANFDPELFRRHERDITHALRSSL